MFGLHTITGCKAALIHVSSSFTVSVVSQRSPDVLCTAAGVMLPSIGGYGLDGTPPCETTHDNRTKNKHA